MILHLTLLAFVALTHIKDRRKLYVYVLTNYSSTYEKDMYRIYTFRQMWDTPYVIVYEKTTALPVAHRL